MNNMNAKQFESLLEAYGSNSHSHLYFLGDKEWFWDSEYKAVIVYRSIGNRRFVLGDPIGDAEAVPCLIEQFIRNCMESKRIPVFYQVKSDFLPLYEKFGFRFVKLGEEAQVDLAAFQLKGRTWLKLRNRMNKFERKGYRFEVLFPPHSRAVLNRLEAISLEWLGKRKEKSFSVGAFATEYVSRFPVAVLMDPAGRIEAFASLGGDHFLENAAPEQGLPVRRMTVDLMRYTNVCPHGTMDVLFLSLFLWGKEQGYQMCSLGMAPLANACSSVAARLVYKYGNRYYNFKGLYEFKDKFAPRWEAAYLAFPPCSVPVTFLMLIFMIHGFGVGKRRKTSQFSMNWFRRTNKQG